MNPAADRYLEERVLTASKAELTSMLFDAAVGALKRAVALQEAGDHAAAAPRLLKAQEIVLELRTTLNHEAGDLALRLDQLYTWCYASLVRANASRDVAATREGLAVLEPLQTAWREACLGAVPVPA